MENNLHIDIEAILKSKSPKMAGVMPSFTINYLKRIVHQDEINTILDSYGHLRGLEFLRSVMSYLDIEYRPEGLDKLPRDGRFLFVSNHPFGGLDGMMLVDELCKYFGDAKIISNDLLMNIVPINNLFVPVNKHGSQSRETLANFRAVMNSDLTVASFPAGLCSRKIKGQVADLPWKTTFIKDAIKSNRDVVPVYFDGELSKFFYRLSNLRKALGLKLNIEMLYLADEMFAQRSGRFTIRFGQPISCQELSANKNLNELASQIRTEVYRMRK